MLLQGCLGGSSHSEVRVREKAYDSLRWPRCASVGPCGIPKRCVGPNFSDRCHKCPRINASEFIYEVNTGSRFTNSDSRIKRGSSLCSSLLRNLGVPAVGHFRPSTSQKPAYMWTGVDSELNNHLSEGAATVFPERKRFQPRKPWPVYYMVNRLRQGVRSD